MEQLSCTAWPVSTTCLGAEEKNQAYAAAQSVLAKSTEFLGCTRPDTGEAMSNGDVRERHAQQLQKTQMCKFFASGRCGKGTECSFAHHPSEIRQRPDLNRTSMCKAFLALGTCSNPRCAFAHDERELRATEGFFKTKLCKFVDSGRCKHGKGCRFAHNIEELTGAARAKEKQVLSWGRAPRASPSPALAAAPLAPTLTHDSSPPSSLGSITSDPFFGEAGA
eukprot:Skav214837  [mRNA]  locus=scaffold1772:316684:321545:+ [translate_table: standard]